MLAFLASQSDTLPIMAKTPAEAPKSPRIPVQLPRAWVDVARKLAAADRQPITWKIVSMIAEAAEEAGMKDLPPLPWEHDDD